MAKINVGIVLGSREEWATRELWSVGEAALLFSGTIPPAMSKFATEADWMEWLAGGQLTLYGRMLDAVQLGLITPEVRASFAGNYRAPPWAFVSWAVAKGVDIPESFRSIKAPTRPAPAIAWAQRGEWTLIEAACLLSGIDPIPAPQFDKNEATGGLAAEIYRELKGATYSGAIEFLESRASPPLYESRLVNPKIAVAWAAAKGIKTPAFLDPLKRGGDESPAERAARWAEIVKAEKALNPRKFWQRAFSKLPEAKSVSNLRRVVDGFNNGTKFKGASR